jgi:hypothetical protein
MPESWREENGIPLATRGIVTDGKKFLHIAKFALP